MRASSNAKRGILCLIRNPNADASFDLIVKRLTDSSSSSADWVGFEKSTQERHLRGDVNYHSYKENQLKLSANMFTDPTFPTVPEVNSHNGSRRVKWQQ